MFELDDIKIRSLEELGWYMWLFISFINLLFWCDGYFSFFVF